VIPLAAFIFGLIIGSFLNVCIYRWPRDESVVKPRSHCPHCGTTIGWQDNIPLLSYLLLKGSCRHCAGPISIRYPLVELLNGLFFAYLFGRFGVDPMTFKVAVFTSMMLILIFTDLSDYILPDEITLGGLVLAFALIPFVPVEDRFTGIIWLFAGEKPEQWIVSLIESGFAAVFIGGLLFVLRSSYFRVRKVEGLGLGDVKMMTMVAAFWGFAPTITILMIGSIVGALTGLAIVVIGRKRWSHELPFGSYLGAASIIVAVWGDDILEWYTRVMIPSA
jgi:leader peptidase (prepilin peptidase)/N-methyltransferase